MTVIALNGLKLSQKLRQAEKTAEAFVEALEEVDLENFAIKHDVSEATIILKRDISEATLTLRKEIAELEMRSQKHTYTVVMTALSINIMALIGAVFAIVKILGH